ncbi:hypothetical protein NKW55_11930, partial [Gluconobacter kondonii]|uniref:hypothetical protein n=1 Tax=Gluconobacter kondonii TaxID=941463 RepID=UPI00209CCC3D
PASEASSSVNHQTAKRQTVRQLAHNAPQSNTTTPSLCEGESVSDMDQKLNFLTKMSTGSVFKSYVVI